jgi:zinc carboxypeptidase
MLKPILVNYTQYEAYLKKLDQESDRLAVLSIGKSSEGRTMYAGIITSPENQKNIDRYKEIARRLSRAEGVTDEQAKSLAAEGKSIVWIDGGLHAMTLIAAITVGSVFPTPADEQFGIIGGILNDPNLEEVPPPNCPAFLRTS